MRRAPGPVHAAEVLTVDATTFVDRAPIELERPFQRGDHLGHRDLLGGTGKSAPAAPAGGALEDLGTGEVGDERRHVAGRDPARGGQVM